MPSALRAPGYTSTRRGGRDGHPNFRWRFIIAAMLLSAPFAAAADAQPKGRPAPRPPAASRGTGEDAWWKHVDTGPFQADTIRVSRTGPVAALKGLAVKLGNAQDVSAVFDTELLCWRASFDGVIQLDGTAWSRDHTANSHYPGGDGRIFFQNPAGLGVAMNGAWRDLRPLDSGPLPRAVGRYRGLYRNGQRTVLHYTVGGTEILELPWLETIDGTRAITRTLNIGATGPRELELLIRTPAQPGDPVNARLKPDIQVYLAGAPVGMKLTIAEDGRTILHIAPSTEATRCKIILAERPIDPARLDPPIDLAPLIRGGPAIFPQTLTVEGRLDPESASKTYAVDVIPLPADNPWRIPPRFGGFDFFPDGRRAALSTWNGDVWIADGIDGDLSKVTWRRFASGLYQTLGLKIVDGVIYTQGRDQITRLHDLNGDDEADHFECFNNDVMITSGFHEFSFGLETDREGNFYFSKAMPVKLYGRGFEPGTPHSGTVLKVSKDGSHMEVVASGLRAPGGLGISPNGVVTTGENEGSWVPACKITWTEPGEKTFNGVVPGKWDGANFAGPLPGAPTDYKRPLCWLPYYADNSSGSQSWVPSETQWDPRHAGEMIHLSYGKSSIFRVLREEVNGQVQGGVYRLPIDVSAAVMRARFHPRNGQLYVVGFRGWQTSGRDAFQRVRFVETRTPLPVGLHAHENGLLIRFSGPLDRATAEDPRRYSINKWNYVWGPQYGSGRFSIDRRDIEAEEKALVAPSKGVHNVIDTVHVGAARLVDDGRAVFLYLPGMTPAMQMEVKIDLVDARGVTVRETIYSTAHALSPEFKIPGVRWKDIRVAESAPAGDPGLLLSFSGVITDVVRVDQVALHTPRGTSPSVFLPPREFNAAWQGMLVVPERDEYTFTLEGAGTATLQIDSKLIASGNLPLAASAPVTLAQGVHSIYCSYSSVPHGESRVRLMWSSPRFRPEPVPASAFRHIPGAEVETWGEMRRGRDLFAAARCIRCHQPETAVRAGAMPELSASVPDFHNIGDRLETDWIEKWVREPRNHCPPVAPTSAADIAAFLVTNGNASAEVASVPSDKAVITSGGSLAEKRLLGFWIEPLMKERKHTDTGLLEQLLDPARHHPDTTFPDFRLTRNEALQVAAYIRSRQPPRQATPLIGDASAGAMVVAHACVACHDPGARDLALPSLDTIAQTDWAVRGCVAEKRDRAPDLGLTASQIAALLAFRNADRDVGMQSLRRFVPAEYAVRQIAALNCIQCHSGKDGLPSITIAGEKLRREWLEDLIAGKHPEKTRTWLEARMPAFASRAAHLSLGLTAGHGVAPDAESPAPDAKLVSIGAALTGTAGYSCIACHDAGAAKALQVFEGQGPNLQRSGERLRYDYFQRWMHFPQRIQPATIMPRYTKDRDTALLEVHFDGNAEKQFEAIWQWMQSLPAAEL